MVVRILVIFVVLVTTACTTLEPNAEKLVTHTLPEASTGLLAETVRKLNLEPGQTAAMPLPAARGALEWRLALVDHASTSIDIQYFIWSHDEVGELLLDRLLDAADRGVRVRILVDMIDEVAGETREQMMFISPYFIPSPDLLEAIGQASSRGITVKILTGGLDSNNHTSVHSHYRKYRRAILATGAELYEFRHDPSDYVRSLSNVPPVSASFISLHLKALIADRDKLFIGSLNLDPRAMEINTENGIYLESATLGAIIADDFELLTSPENAWRVTVNEEDKLQWESSEGMVYSQPARHFGQRIADFFLRILPIESQL